MKDFLYLDTDTVSSISAQIFEGNTLEMIKQKGSTESETTNDSRINTSGEGTGSKIGVYTININENKNSSLTESITNIWNESSTLIESTKKAYDDFLYNRIFSELDKLKLINKEELKNQYDYVELSGKFEIYDISVMKDVFEHEFIKRVIFFKQKSFELPALEDIESLKTEAKKLIREKKNGSKNFPSKEDAEAFLSNYLTVDMFNTLQSASSNMDKLLDNKIVFIQDNTIIIGKKDYLRIPAESLTLSGDIKAKGLGKVLTSVEEVQPIKYYEEFNGTFDDKFMQNGFKNIVILLCSFYFGLNRGKSYEIIHPVGLELIKN